MIPYPRKKELITLQSPDGFWRVDPDMVGTAFAAVRRKGAPADAERPLDTSANRPRIPLARSQLAPRSRVATLPGRTNNPTQPSLENPLSAQTEDPNEVIQRPKRFESWSVRSKRERDKTPGADIPSRPTRRSRSSIDLWSSSHNHAGADPENLSTPFVFDVAGKIQFLTGNPIDDDATPVSSTTTMPLRIKKCNPPSGRF